MTASVRKAYNRLKGTKVIRVVPGLLLVLLGGLLAGCGTQETPLPEVDRYKLDFQKIVDGQRDREVRSLIGPPAFIIDPDSEAFRGTTWIYPVRFGNTGRCCVPAPLLRVAFDSRGQVKGWGFLHPVTGSEMAVKETLEEVDKKRRRKCNPPPRIVLRSGIKAGVSNREEVEMLLRLPWANVFPWNKTTVRKLIEKEGEMWTYFVDRPSPVYTPSFLYVVEFRNGVVASQWLAGYGGCK